MRVTVFGGTGIVGSAAARQLREQGWEVRIATRDPERADAALGHPDYPVAAADAQTGAGVDAAVAGADALYIAIDHPAEDRCVQNVVQAAAAAGGVKRVLYISGGTVRPENAWFPLCAGKLQAEAHLAASGIPWTVLAPTWFYETLARFVRGGRATVIGRDRRVYHWLAADDLGRIAARLLTDDEGINQRYIIHGPETMRIGEAVQRYCAALHPEIAKISHPPQLLLRLIAWRTHNAVLRGAIDLMAYFERVGEPGEPADAAALMGGPLMPFDAWLQSAGA